MEDVIKEDNIIGYPNVINFDCTKKIIEQMEKNICKILIGKIQGTGFFCKIPYPDKNNLLPVFITNNHIINKDFLNQNNPEISIFIKENKSMKKMNLKNRIKYTNKDYDVTIIEVKESDEIKNFLELDDKIINDIVDDNLGNDEYIGKTVYILQYPNNELSVSYGVIDDIFGDKKFEFIHKCSTQNGSSGSPVLNLKNKIIGIHKECVEKKYNRGSFINYAIREFINQTHIKKQDKDFPYELVNFKKSYIGSMFPFKTIMENFYNVGMKRIKELNLSGLVDISFLSGLTFENLEILDLSDNLLLSIKCLEKMNCKNLKELYLYYNYLNNLEVLTKVEFRNLEILDLHSNRIVDINPLSNINFKRLKGLNLSDNKIIRINALINIKLGKLEYLNLSKNDIIDIDIKLLEQAYFKELKCLNIFGISIITSKIIENFKKLKKLDLTCHDISNINLLEKYNFKNITTKIDKKIEYPIDLEFERK